MLRIALLLLILANLLFLVWAQGWLGSQEEGREPQRLTSQIAPEKLRVSVIDPALRKAPPTTESCRLVKGLQKPEALRLAAQAEAKLPGSRVATSASTSRETVYWVFIPTQQNEFAAEKKAGELKKRGVSDFSVVTEEGEDKFSISFGLFNTEQLADNHLQELMKRGVRSARIKTRERLLESIQVEVRGPAETLAKQLPDLLGGQAAATVADCAEGH